MIERGCGEMQKAELPSRVVPLLLTNCLVRGQSIFLMLFLASQYIVIYRSFFLQTETGFIYRLWGRFGC